MSESVLVQRGTEFEHSLTRPFYGSYERQLRRRIKEQNHTVEFALARAASER